MMLPGAVITSKSVTALPDAPKRSDSAEAILTMTTPPPLPPIARNNTLAPPDTAERLSKFGCPWLDFLLQYLLVLLTVLT